MIRPFSFSRAPALRFGAGRLAELPSLAARYGKNVLTVTGGRSLEESGSWKRIEASFRDASLRLSRAAVSGEPSPAFVDETAAQARKDGAEAVVGIGGGSAMDAAKAVAAMLRADGSVRDYIEGVGDRTHPGDRAPLIAVPTTAGTGSEATKNAVLSEVGPDGFKKSLRHEGFIPDIALVDPELMLACPPEVSAACGLDAFVQLLEAYVSIKASPMTDALAWSGLERAARSLLPSCADKAGDIGARSDMAYAAFLSGAALANAGLGVVHGLAGPLGGRFAAPHGVVCGALAAPATRANAAFLREHHPDHPALAKYARLGALLTGEEKAGPQGLVRRLEEWTLALRIPGLRRYGLKPADAEGLAAKASNKNSPAELPPEEIRRVLEAAL